MLITLNPSTEAPSRYAIQGLTLPKLDRNTAVNTYKAILRTPSYREVPTQVSLLYGDRSADTTVSSRKISSRRCTHVLSLIYALSSCFETTSVARLAGIKISVRMT